MDRGMTTDSNREAFEKYKAEWSDEDCPMMPEEEHAYKAGFNDGYQAATAHNKERLREVRNNLKAVVLDAIKADDESFNDDESIGWDGDKCPLPVTFGDLRRAKAAIATLNEMIGGE